MKVIYFHGLLGDLGKLEKIRRICIDQKADTVICGGDFYYWEHPFVGKYMETVQEIINGKRNYIQCFGDQDNLYPFLEDKYKNIKGFHLCCGDKKVEIDKHEFVSIPWTNDPRFRFKHFYRDEGDKTPCLSEPCIVTSNYTTEGIQGQFKSMKEQIDELKIEEMVSRRTILITHNPPAVNHNIAKDINMVNRGSKTILDLIEKKRPWMVLSGHTSNSNLEMNGAQYIYQSGGKQDFWVVNPTPKYVFMLEMRKKSTYYSRILIND